MMSVPYLALCMACLASVFWDARCQDAYSGNFSIENCNWGRQHVLDFAGKKVNVSIAGFAGHNLSANVTCTTNIYARNDYIHLKVSRFSLLGCSKCTPSSERLTISHAGFRTSDSITWCGETYAEELYFKGTVILEYNTGLHGEGDGFDIEVSRVTRPCVEEQTLTVTDKPRLLYSPLYPNKYPNLLNCRYKLLGLGQNLRIRSLSFDVEWKDRCLYDYLRINQVRYCGIQSIDVLETSNFNSARVHFHTDRNIGLTGYVLEYFHEHQYPVVCDGNTSLKLIELPSNESSLLIEVKINRTTKSNCTLEIDAGSDDKVLEIRTPSRQNSIDCNNVFIHTYNHSSWQFTGCPRPVSYLRTSRRTFRFMVTTTGIRREGSTGDYDVFSLHVTPLGKDILPPLLSAENTTSFVWIDKEMMRNSSQYVTHITKPSGWKCIKVQTLRFDMGQLQEYGSGSSRQSPNLMPVSDWLTVHNGRNSSYFDLTMGCGSSKSTDSQIYSKGTDVVTVSVNMRMEPKTGFWFSFQATDECTWPVIQLNGNRGKLHPRYNWKLKNLFCTWEIRKSSNSYYSTEAVKIKANNNFSMISSNRFRVFEVGRNDIKKIADVNQGSSRNMWVHVDGSARVEVEIVSAPANIPPPNIFDFEYVLFYSSPKQCGPYELKALTSPQLAYTPNYPNFYLRKTKCTWIITKDPSAKGSLLLIKFPVIICHTLTNQKVYTSSVSGSNHNWHLESTACFNGYSNKKPKSQEYRAEALKIEFESDYPYPSFNFTYGIGGCVNTLINLTDYGMSYTLHNVLPPWTQIRRDCLFRVITEPSHVIRVSFDKLSLNQDNTHYCGDNFFTVTDKCDNGNSLGKSCGAIKEKTSVTSLGNVIVIRLHTEISTSMDIVYNFTLTAVPRDPCTQRRFVYARDRRQKMDYYPSDSGKSCETWVIRNTDSSKYINFQLDTTEFRIGFLYESCPGVQISMEEYEIPFIQGTRVHLNRLNGYKISSHSTNGSVGKSLIIEFTVLPHFRSQGFIGFFQLKDSAQDQQLTKDISGSDTMSTLGGPIGASIFLVIAFLFCFLFAWIKRHRQKRQANRDTLNRTIAAVHRRGSSIYTVRPEVEDISSLPPPYASYASPGYDLEPPQYPATERDISLTNQRQDSPPSYDFMDSPWEYEEPPPYSTHAFNNYNGNENEGAEATRSVISAVQYDNREEPRVSMLNDGVPVYQFVSRFQDQGGENLYNNPSQSNTDEPPDYHQTESPAYSSIC